MWLKRLLRIGIAAAGLWIILKIFFTTVYPIADIVRADVQKTVKQNGGIYRSIDQIPVQYQLAVVSTEDRRFYSHPGVDFWGIGRSLYINLKEGPVQGGSTITQQLVKNTILSDERTLERKGKEMALALALETQMSKRQILELYINDIYYGNGAYGAEKAANVYFGRPLSDLSYPEWSLLAGLPNAPSVYNPYSSFDLSKQRQREVLQNLVETGHLSEKEAAAYAQAPLRLASQSH